MTTVITFIASFFNGFFHAPATRRACLRYDRAVRGQLGENQLDTMIDDSFPASDPPSTY